MTPHAVIEGMLQAVKDHGGYDRLGAHIDLTVWPDVLRALQSTVHFELGEARPMQEHEDFAFDLFERELLQMPFPSTFWTGKASPNTAILFSEADPVSWRMTGPHAGGSRGMGLVIIGQMMDPTGRQQWHVPLVAGRMSYTPLAADGAVRFGWRGLTTGAKSRKTGEDWKDDQFQAAIDKSFRLACGATAMLMTPDIDQRIEAAPAKLNAARAKKGRPPIGERRVIVIRQHAIEALSGNAARIAFDGRSGPKPHMRRGHFRKLHRGSELERIIPVAPCVVGVTDEARAKVMPKQYVVAS